MLLQCFYFCIAHLNGFPIQEAKAELRKIVAFTESEHTAFVNHKKKEIVDFHLHNNPFTKN
jgi:phenylacetate-CoA ligase